MRRSRQTALILVMPRVPRSRSRRSLVTRERRSRALAPARSLRSRRAAPRRRADRSRERQDAQSAALVDVPVAAARGAAAASRTRSRSSSTRRSAPSRSSASSARRRRPRRGSARRSATRSSRRSWSSAKASSASPTRRGRRTHRRRARFPLFAFGGGARFTLRFTDRFGVYVQGSVGLMEADIRKRALEIIGLQGRRVARALLRRTARARVVPARSPLRARHHVGPSRRDRLQAHHRQRHAARVRRRRIDSLRVLIRRAFGLRHDVGLDAATSRARGTGCILHALFASEARAGKNACRGGYA